MHGVNLSLGFASGQLTVLLCYTASGVCASIRNHIRGLRQCTISPDHTPAPAHTTSRSPAAQGGPDATAALDDALLVRIVQSFGSARSRARLAATSTRFARAVDAAWNCLTVCSPREAPLAWTVRLLREKELAFLEELTVHVRPRWSLTSNKVSQTQAALLGVIV